MKILKNLPTQYICLSREAAGSDNPNLWDRNGLFCGESLGGPLGQPAATPVGLDVLLAANIGFEGLAAVGTKVGPLILSKVIEKKKKTADS